MHFALYYAITKALNRVRVSRQSRHQSAAQFTLDLQHYMSFELYPLKKSEYTFGSLECNGWNVIECMYLMCVFNIRI